MIEENPQFNVNLEDDIEYYQISKQLYKYNSFTVIDSIEKLLYLHS